MSHENLADYRRRQLALWHPRKVDASQLRRLRKVARDACPNTYVKTRNEAVRWAVVKIAEHWQLFKRAPSSDETNLVLYYVTMSPIPEALDIWGLKPYGLRAVHVGDMVLCDAEWYEVLDVTREDGTVTLFAVPHKGPEREINLADVEQIDPKRPR